MLEIKTAEEIIEANVDLESQQGRRRASRETPTMQAIYRIFLARGGPISVQEIVTEMASADGSAVESSLASLDEDDLIHFVDGQVELAYPFSAHPTSFGVRLDDGRERSQRDSRHGRRACSPCGASALDFGREPLAQ